MLRVAVILWPFSSDSRTLVLCAVSFRQVDAVRYLVCQTVVFQAMFDLKN